MTPRCVLVVLLFAGFLVPGLGRAAEPAAGPRPGKYLIHSYGAVSKPPLYLGYVVLKADGSYEVFLPGDKSSGTGNYVYDAAKQEVVWKSGPYEKDWGGAFTVEREGKTHKIRLKRTTIATHSTDAKP